jgi:hypothetical protein
LDGCFRLIVWAFKVIKPNRSSNGRIDFIISVCQNKAINMTLI